MDIKDDRGMEEMWRKARKEQSREAYGCFAVTLVVIGLLIWGLIEIT